MNRVAPSKWWLKAVAMVLAVAMVIISAPFTGMAATSKEPSFDQIITALQQYGIVRGDQNNDLQLDSTITRAEMATVLVRILGREQDASLVAGAKAFPDTGDHWASGYIAVAQHLNLIKGYEDGTFKPNAPVRYAEVLTMLLRVVGQEPAFVKWPEGVIDRATTLGITPPGIMVSLVALESAPRRHVFHSLFLAGTRVAGADGQNLMQKFVKAPAPQLTLDSVPGAVPGDRVSISGTATGAFSVTINGREANITTTGRFTGEATLNQGYNTITVVAYDIIGNKTEKSVQVARGGAPARIEVTGPSEVGVGTTTPFTVKAYDSAGVEVPTTGLAVETTGSIGIFDVATTSLKAPGTTGSGTLRFKLAGVTKELSIRVLGPASNARALRVADMLENHVFPINQETTVRINVVDADGALLTEDNERTVSLSVSGLSGAVVTPSSAKTRGGVATFSVKSVNGGTAKLTATAGGLTTAELPIQFATPLRVELTSSVSRMDPNGYGVATISATLKNADGKNSSYVGNGDLKLELSVSGPGTLTDDTIAIRPGYSSAWDTATIESNGKEGTINISGRVVSGSGYTVLPVSISVANPTLNADARLIVDGPYRATPGSWSTYTVRLVDKDGASIRNGSYAFQLQISTSTNEKKVNGVPEGVEVYLGGTGLVPVDDGIAEGNSSDSDDVIGRIVDGRAEISLLYRNSGVVTVKPVPKGSGKAYSDSGEEASAQATTVIPEKNLVAADTSFAGAPAKLVIEGDSALGNKQPGAAVAARSGATATIRVRVADDKGNWVPGNRDYTVTLKQEDPKGGPTTVGTKAVRDGYAEFTVRVSDVTGAFKYTATATGKDPATLATERDFILEVEEVVPDQPVIVSAGGSEPGYIRTDDPNLVLVVDSIPGEGWATLKVFREGSTTPIYTSGAVDLSSTVVISIPKSQLPKGNYAYVVSAKNSRGESRKSEPSQVVTVAGSTSVSINNARFTGTWKDKNGTDYGSILTVYTSGSVACVGGTIYPSRLAVRNGSNKYTLDNAIPVIGSTPEQPCTSSSVSQFHLLLHPDDVATLLSSDYASKDAILEAESGWYEGPNREQAAADKTGNKISLLAYVERAEYDRVGNQLHLFGGGFQSVSSNLDITKVTVSGIPLTTTNAGSPLKASDTKITIPLKAALALADPTVDLKDGWLTDSSTRAYVAAAQTATLYQYVTVTGVSYTAKTASAPAKVVIRGRGFREGKADGPVSTVELANLAIKNYGKDGTTCQLSGDVDVTDSTITITLSDNLPTTCTSGTAVFLQADTGWLTGASGLEAHGLPERTYRVTK